MIETKNLMKRFEDIKAVNNVSLTIKKGCIFGLVGTNGAGKSTLLRLMAGILKPDAGTVKIDEEDVFENPNIKERIFYIPEDAYFFVNSTPLSMMEYYAKIYPSYNKSIFIEMMERFKMDGNRKVQTFSKGMQKQLSILLGVASGADYLLCDETFDGLDPVMRQAVKSVFVGEVIKRELTPVIASHNLRELEDVCDHVGLLHEGGILLSEDLEDAKFHIHKIQCVLPDEVMENHLLHQLDVIHTERSGSLLLITARGTRMEITDCINRHAPVYSEIIPLSLEEIFISETEVAGYEVQNILF